INTLTSTINGPQIISAVLSLALLIPGIAVAVRRLHDIGKSGWWYPILMLAAPVFSLVSLQLLLMVGTPMIFAVMPPAAAMFGILYLIFWLANPSDPNTNKYGPNPNEVLQ
ncbi:MAG: DUF805 domain-containing protein, partial [Pseudomonadota bacterium]